MEATFREFNLVFQLRDGRRCLLGDGVIAVSHCFYTSRYPVGLKQICPSAVGLAGFIIYILGRPPYTLPL